MTCGSVCVTGDETEAKEPQQVRAGMCVRVYDHCCYLKCIRSGSARFVSPPAQRQRTALGVKSRLLKYAGRMVCAVVCMAFLAFPAIKLPD